MTDVRELGEVDLAVAESRQIDALGETGLQREEVVQRIEGECLFDDFLAVGIPWPLRAFTGVMAQSPTHVIGKALIAQYLSTTFQDFLRQLAGGGVT